MSSAKCARQFLLRRTCEAFNRPFDSQDIFLAQHYNLTRDEVEQELARAPYLVVVRPVEHNSRTLYEYRRECRSLGPVSYAIYPRRCSDAKCRRIIAPGEVFYNPRNYSAYSRRSSCLCKECGLKAIAMEVERLVNMQ